ncbi:MAG: zinc ribbon domain-containing protein [Caulobacterales bacterium]|nr:zinc ribbon domain-containing protein [Caulobacterales bacterium]
MGAFGILGYGAYVPRKRMSRHALFDAIGWAQPSLKKFAKGARAFAAWDEDAITMAVEAARAALKTCAREPDGLCFASTTAPFLDRQNAGVVAAALDLPRASEAFDISGSQRAATSALIQSAERRAATTLLAAADRRPAASASALEMLSGHAGAAMIVGEGEPIAQIEQTSAIYADFVDHYRTAASGTDYALEDRWFREEGIAKLVPDAVGPLLERAGVSPGDVDHLIAPLPDPALARAVARAAGVETSAIADPLFDTCGHAGAAHPLLMLAHVLHQARPGERILLTGIGQGVDALLLRVTDAITAVQQRSDIGSQLALDGAEENYTRFLAASGDINIDWGLRAERDNRTAQTVAFNKSRDVYGFVGGLCGACGTPQFPKSRRCVNPDCGALDRQEDHRFADRAASVKSFTEDWLAFTRDPPLIYGNISFEGGGNVFMETCGFNPGDIAVGAPVKMRFRIKDIDAPRGFHRYFWKAAPASGSGHG